VEQIVHLNNKRRSKGEILFSELCIEEFGKGDILCNEQIFKDINELISRYLY
jgi:hypothetical protein